MGAMQIVALSELATAIEEEAVALAADLGTVAYEERLKLAGGLPAVLLMTADPARATTLIGRLRARGHGVVACSAADVVPHSAMISLRRFALDSDALVASDRADARLPWSDVAALVRANDKRRVESATVVAEKKFDLTRTIVTSGLLRSRTTTRTVTRLSDDSEPVLYIFRHSGATPWILREQGTHYEALGARLGSTAAPNFAATVGELRARAPEARYDDRLTGRRRPSELAAGKVTSPHDLDLLAHLVAQSLAARS